MVQVRRLTPQAAGGQEVIWECVWRCARIAQQRDTRTTAVCTVEAYRRGHPDGEVIKAVSRRHAHGCLCLQQLPERVARCGFTHFACTVGGCGCGCVEPCAVCVRIISPRCACCLPRRMHADGCIAAGFVSDSVWVVEGSYSFASC